MLEINEYTNLLDDFQRVHKVIKQPTYLELCRYPHNRFEEICTRLLCFYLDPKEEHCFKKLFLESLLELVEPLKRINFINENILVKSEVNSEGKRLDFLVCSDSFVIGVENKITTSLYNPLEYYANEIDKYNSKNSYRIILSLRKIYSLEEKNYLKAHKFVNYTYSEYFKIIKKNLGFYLNECNEKYLTFLKDFINTIENMENNSNLNKELNDFIFDNYEKIDNLVKYYNEYNKNQLEHIKELMNTLTEKTKYQWNIWDENGVPYFLNCKLQFKNYIIGIDSYFDAIKGNMIGDFIYGIRTWNRPSWNYFESKIINIFKDKKPDFNNYDGGVFMKFESIDGNDENKIIKKLSELYSILNDITKE